MSRFLTLQLILVLLTSSCGSRISWQPPLLPVKVVFSEQGIQFELEVGVDVPYIGRLSLEHDLAEIETDDPSLLVRINGETHQYNLEQQSGRKFEGIICETKCKIFVEQHNTGNILLDIHELGSAKDASLVPNPANFDIALQVDTHALNIRSSPGVDYNRIGTVSIGDTLFSDGSTRKAKDGGLWYRVLVPPGSYHEGKEGWVNAKFVNTK